MNRIGPIYRHCTPVIYDIIKRVGAMPDVVVIDLRRVLIQGAVPTQQNVLDRHNNFQGGYRNTIEIVSQPHVGLARVSADHFRQHGEYRLRRVCRERNF